MKQLIVIEGPTASGKTAISIALAKQFNTVILSADSRQFYKEISIGTAKPSLEEQEGIKHYFIDSHNLIDEVTAAQYEEESLVLLSELFKIHDKIILTGGSGMFIDALCLGLDPIPADKELRDKVTEEFRQNGLHPLLEELKKTDPHYYEIVDKENPMRIIRAIEVIRLTGVPYSAQRSSTPAHRTFRVHRYVLNHERAALYERINNRVDEMMRKGLLDEVKSVQAFSNLSSLNTVGYKELFEFLEGKVSLEEAVENIKQNTRRYAKRQLTWFRRHEDAKWINYISHEQVVGEIIKDFVIKNTD